ncbi:MAG TPA: PAS domain S-box protein [Desulfonatronum sp.]|nr:PAS domain S-box protein [Desulfonatronum sp.]
MSRLEAPVHHHAPDESNDHWPHCIPSTENRGQFTQMLLEALNESVVVIDDQHRISYANQKFFALTGLVCKDVLGKEFASLLPGCCHTQLDHAIRALSEGQKTTVEIQLSDTNGSPLHLIMSASPLPGPAGAFSGGVALLTDITAQKRVNDAVLKAKQEWERTFDAVRDFLCIVDRHNTIKRVNMRLAQYFEAHPRELIGKSCEDLFDFCLPPSGNARNFALQSKETGLQREVYSYNLGGFFQVSVYPFNDPSTGIQGLVYVIRDVNPQKKLETLLRDVHKQVEDQVRRRTQDLRRANKDLIEHIQQKEAARQELARLASIIEQVDESIVLANTDWTVTYVNPAFVKMTGTDWEQGLSQGMNLLGFIEHPTVTRSNMDEVMRGKGMWRGYFTKYRRDGSRYDVKAQVSPLKNKDGEIINFIAMLCDVTQELRMERRIRNSEKMEAIGIFAGGIAHDFNNILGGIIGSIELAADQLTEEDPVFEDLQEALAFADNARKLVREILSFKRQDSLAAFPLSALSAIQEAVEITRHLMPEKIRIIENLQPTTWLVLTNSTHIQQIMMNLCTNAAHAMNGCGDIEVGLVEKILPLPTAVHDNVLPPGEYLHLTVKDTGCGVAQGILEHIFEPLFSTKKGLGSGMGLPIVNAVVHRLGGGMHLEGREAQGTTIHVYLPRCVPENENRPC